MNRRHFIESLVGAAAGLALEEAIPFNRVWFFPKKIRLANNGEWPVGRHLQIKFPQRWLVNAEATYQEEHQIWIVKSVADPIDWRIIDGRLIPREPAPGFRAIPLVP